MRVSVGKFEALFDTVNPPCQGIQVAVNATHTMHHCGHVRFDCRQAGFNTIKPLHDATLPLLQSL